MSQKNTISQSPFAELNTHNELYSMDTALFNFSMVMSQVKAAEAALAKAHDAAIDAMITINNSANKAISNSEPLAMSLRGTKFKRSRLEFDMDNDGNIFYLGEVDGGYTGIQRTQEQ